MTPARFADDLHEQIRATRDTIDCGRALLAQARARLGRARIGRLVWPSPRDRSPLVPEQPIRPDFNPAPAMPIPIELLTQREIEILQLLDARLSNEEIAAVLHLPSEAMQRQTYRIYRKLVVGRRDAIVPEDGSLS